MKPSERAKMTGMHQESKCSISVVVKGLAIIKIFMANAQLVY